MSHHTPGRCLSVRCGGGARWGLPPSRSHTPHALVVQPCFCPRVLRPGGLLAPHQRCTPPLNLNLALPPSPPLQVFRQDGLLSLQHVPDFTDPSKTVDQYGSDWFEGAIARPGKVRCHALLFQFISISHSRCACPSQACRL